MKGLHIWTYCLIPLLDVALIKLKGPRMSKEASVFNCIFLGQQEMQVTSGYHVGPTQFGLSNILFFLPSVNIKSFTFLW